MRVLSPKAHGSDLDPCFQYHLGDVHKLYLLLTENKSEIQRKFDLEGYAARVDSQRLRRDTK